MAKTKKPKTKTKIKKDGFIKSIRNEMKLVKWPSAKEVIKYSIATIVFCLIMCAFFLALYFLLTSVVGEI